MTLVWVAVLALSASPSEATPASNTPAASSAEVRTGRELADAVRAALKGPAKVSDQEAPATARELLGLYHELQQDKSLPWKQRDELSQRVRTRLAGLSAQIARHSKEARSSDVKSVAMPNSAKTLGQVGGGAVANAGGGNQANSDDGPALVELIETVIQPKSWEKNGGNGTIYYWQGQRAIVVRNTSEVHSDIADALDQLGRANR